MSCFRTRLWSAPLCRGAHADMNWEKFKLTLTATDWHTFPQLPHDAQNSVTDYHRLKINKSCNKFKVAIEMKYCQKFPKIYIDCHRLPQPKNEKLMRNWWRANAVLVKYWLSTDEELMKTDEELMKNWQRADEELMNNWWRNYEELMKNWWKTNEELMKNWWKTDEKLMQNWWQIDEEPMKTWWRTDEELRKNW